MNLSDFDYHLPKEMIAQRPLKNRDQSKLMVLNRADQTIEHHQFFELPTLLDENSVLVLNESKVIPARLKFEMGNGNAEILLIKPIHDNTWECMVRPGRKFDPKTEVTIDSECSFHVKDITPHGLRTIKFYCDDFKDYLQKNGHTPTPPYIKEEVEDPEVYQTVYAKEDGSVAAPTAGFHFTQRVFDDLKKKGIQTEFVTLHVGLGTFQPVKTDNITEHPMHSEWFSLSDGTAERLNKAKKEGKKIVAVGTTSVRVLETCSDSSGKLTPYSGETDIFIYPGYQWKFVDQLITNFHVPKSTLVMLVSSFASFCHPVLNQVQDHSGSKMNGHGFVLKAYETAKKEGYRFFSFGDSMLIR
ncbi:tRNA preQ1(34) S-adenosylmethionine ribosyltransferase-isomerase QueA [Patescibacteria group bacterium]|nr:tRNA preQ1(34) S-adenosylmethionine ribosyltransferase-isomerase QueA [Patescibacteria group bacterium]